MLGSTSNVGGTRGHEDKELECKVHIYLGFNVELPVPFPCFSGGTLGKIPEANEAESK